MDEATGGRFQPNVDKLANVNQKLRAISGIDDAKEAELSAAKVRLEWQQEELFNQATKNGVPKDVVDTARAQFRQAQALEDLDSKVFKNPAIIGGNVIHGAEETVDVAKAVKALQKMQDDIEFGAPRLEQALGKEGARAVLNDMYAAEKSGIKAMTKHQWAKRIALYVGLPTAEYEILHSLF